MYVRGWVGVGVSGRRRLMYMVRSVKRDVNEVEITFRIMCNDFLLLCTSNLVSELDRFLPRLRGL